MHALWVMNAGGGQPMALSEPLFGMGAVAWSPAGSRVAVAHNDHGYPRVSVYRTDGRGGTPLEIPFPVSDPVWRPGHDDQLLVRGRETGREYDLYLVDIATGATSALGIPHDPAGWQQYDGQRPSWSPDGSQLVFEQGLSRLGTLGLQVIRLRVADVAADGTLSGIRPLELDPMSDYEYMGRWLTTGDRLAFATQEGCTWQVYVAPGLDVSRATPVGEPFEDCTNEGIDYELSPDGSKVVTVRGTADEADPMWIGGTDGTAIEPVSGTVTDVPTWQRLAP
jgi:Tol biopolymer transport system component